MFLVSVLPWLVAWLHLQRPSWQNPCSMDTNLTGRKKPILWCDDYCFRSWSYWMEIRAACQLWQCCPLSKVVYSFFCSINTVYYMAPFATMILALPAMLLEGGGVIDWFYTHDSIMSALIIILGSGVLAFCLNFSIFYVIHSTTAVTFNVAGNLKVRLRFGLCCSPLLHLLCMLL